LLVALSYLRHDTLWLLETGVVRTLADSHVMISMLGDSMLPGGFLLLDEILRLPVAGNVNQLG